MTRYVWVYSMAGDPDLVRATVSRNTEYWHSISLPGYAGGPFADRNGGLITFLADDDEAARGAVQRDPFVRAGAIGTSWLKPWQPIGADEPLAELQLT